MAHHLGPVDRTARTACNLEARGGASGYSLDRGEPPHPAAPDRTRRRNHRLGGERGLHDSDERRVRSRRDRGDSSKGAPETARVEGPAEGQSMGRRADLRYERKLWRDGIEAVAGVDEAGVGPMAGPVVAAAVMFAPEAFIKGVHDSK